MNPRRNLLIVTLALLSSTALAGETQRVIADFTRDGLDGWKEQQFKDKALTQYQLLAAGPGQVLKATSHHAASGWVRELPIDLAATPWLTWSWKVENVLPGVDEHAKPGDDYPARLYVVFSGGVFFWKTRALNYVWSSNQPVGSEWPSAYTGNSRMVAMDSGSARLGQWVQHKVNVREDFKRVFGEELTQADAIAIMTDTDDSGQQAVAYYGNIAFSAGNGSGP